MKLGFIGCGNMAQAIIRGIISSKLLEPNEIMASDVSNTLLDNVNNKYCISTTNSNLDIAKKCEIIFLAIKPHFYNDIINEIKSYINDNTIIVTIAPGKTLEYLEDCFNKNTKIIRCMPNTPAMVNEGMTAICPNKFISEDELNYVIKLLSCFSKTEVIDENLMDAVVCVSGSSPAYVYIMIEAMADAAVLEGMPRNMAYKFAAQAVLGSAKMVLETNMHPGALKDMVCSPKGTTIEAVRVLEKTGFRSSIMEAMKACAFKSGKM